MKWSSHSIMTSSYQRRQLIPVGVESSKVSYPSTDRSDSDLNIVQMQSSVYFGL